DKKTTSLVDFQLLSVIGQGAFGKDAVRFYLAEMILALEHLHGNFDKKFTDMPASDLACDPVVDEDDRLFRGFSFYRQESLKDLMDLVNVQSPVNTDLLPTIASLVATGDDIKDINDAIATAASKQSGINILS
ncbi:hypothetical protein BBJ28_00015005, partial [Nothophytophthora sp. Chile5]